MPSSWHGLLSGLWVLLFCLQVLLALGDYMNVQCHACIGGTNVGEDIRKLDYGQHVVAGTPGRVFGKQTGPVGNRLLYQISVLMNRVALWVWDSLLIANGKVTYVSVQTWFVAGVWGPELSRCWFWMKLMKCSIKVGQSENITHMDPLGQLITCHVMFRV